MEGIQSEVMRRLCEYLGGSGTVFLPETERDGTASVSFTGGGELLRTYVDGSYLMAIPFDVRIRRRRASNDVSAKLDACRYFERLNEYVGSSPMGEGLEVLPTLGRAFGGTYSKSAIYEDGTEEFRAGYILKIYIKGARSE